MVGEDIAKVQKLKGGKKNRGVISCCNGRQWMGQLDYRIGSSKVEVHRVFQ